MFLLFMHRSILYFNGRYLPSINNMYQQANIRRDLQPLRRISIKLDPPLSPAVKEVVQTDSMISPSPRHIQYLSSTSPRMNKTLKTNYPKSSHQFSNTKVHEISQSRQSIMRIDLQEDIQRPSSDYKDLKKILEQRNAQYLFALDQKEKYLRRLEEINRCSNLELASKMEENQKLGKIIDALQLKIDRIQKLKSIEKLQEAPDRPELVQSPVSEYRGKRPLMICKAISISFIPENEEQKVTKVYVVKPMHLARQQKHISRYQLTKEYSMWISDREANGEQMKYQGESDLIQEKGTASLPVVLVQIDPDPKQTSFKAARMKNELQYSASIEICLQAQTKAKRTFSILNILEIGLHDQTQKREATQIMTKQKQPINIYQPSLKKQLLSNYKEIDLGILPSKILQYSDPTHVCSFPKEQKLSRVLEYSDPMHICLHSFEKKVLGFSNFMHICLQSCRQKDGKVSKMLQYSDPLQISLKSFDKVKKVLEYSDSMAVSITSPSSHGSSQHQSSPPSQIHLQYQTIQRMQKTPILQPLLTKARTQNGQGKAFPSNMKESMSISTSTDIPATNCNRISISHKHTIKPSLTKSLTYGARESRILNSDLEKYKGQVIELEAQLRQMDQQVRLRNDKQNELTAIIRELESALKQSQAQITQYAAKTLENKDQIQSEKEVFQSSRLQERSIEQIDRESKQYLEEGQLQNSVYGKCHKKNQKQKQKKKLRKSLKVIVEKIPIPQSQSNILTPKIPPKQPKHSFPNNKNSLHLSTTSTSTLSSINHAKTQFQTVTNDWILEVVLLLLFSLSMSFATYISKS